MFPVFAVHLRLRLLLLLAVFLGSSTLSFAQQSTKPDLFIGSILVSPTVGPPSGPVDMTFELRNGGNVDAGPFNVSIYYSTTATLDPTKAVLLKSIAVVGLKSGTTSVQRITVNIPKNAVINTTAYLGVWVDSGKTVSESNEANNTTTATFNVKPGPDVTITSASPNAPQIIIGQYVTVTYVLKNVGRANMRPFSTYLYFSPDPLIDQTDPIVDRYAIQTLRMGDSITVKRSFRIPTTATLNKVYTIGIVTDAKKENIEEDESNNSTTIKITVIPPNPKKYSDNIIPAFQLVDTSKPLGENVRFNFTIKNQGQLDSRIYLYVQYALSPRFLTVYSDRYMRKLSYYSLPAGASKSFTNYTFQVPWRSPFNQRPRVYYVRLYITGSSEQVTSNNYSQILKFTALPGKSRLNVTNFTYSPSVCNYVLDASGNIKTPKRLKGRIYFSNSGYEPSKPTRLGLVLSKDKTINSSDTVIHSFDIPSIPAGGSYDRYYDIALNAKVVEGTYYMGVVVDPQNTLSDDYGTGTRSRLLYSYPVWFSKTVPDISVEKIVVTPSSQQAAGGTIKVEATIRNTFPKTVLDSCYYRNRYLRFGFWEDSALRRYRYGTTRFISNKTSRFVETATFTIPTTVLTTSGYVGVIVDPDGYYTDANRANNSKVVPYKLVPRDRDYTFLSSKIQDKTLVWEKTNKIEFQVDNVGALQDRYSIRVCAYLSYNKTWEPQDAYLGSSYLSNYRTAKPTGSIGFTSQRWAPTSTAYILLDVNCSNAKESNKSNNWAVLPITIRKFNVDFVTTKMVAAPLPIRPSSTTTVTVEVKNQGLDKHIKSIAVCLYYSEDKVYDTKDQLLMCRLTTDIYAKTGVATLQLTGTRNLVAGKRFLVAKLDTGRHGPYGYRWYTHPTYDETNENNNLYVIPAEVKNDTDLTAGALAVSKTLAKIGENITFRFQVKNAGSVSTNIAFNVWAVFSDDPNLDQKDVAVRKIRLPILDAGKITPFFNVSYAIPKSQQPGERYFGLLIDTNDEVKESDEKNNTASVKINVLIPGIDLQLRYARLDRTVIPSGTATQVTVFSEVQNFGTVSSPPFEVGYYLSTDKKFDPGDTLLSSYRYTKTLPSVARSGQIVSRVNLTLKQNTSYYLLVVVDPRNQVREALETNNMQALEIRIVNQIPRITSLPVTKATEGKEYVYNATAFDPDKDPLTWRLLKGPPEMALDAKTGKLTWTPASFEGGKTFEVVIEVSDGRGGVAKQTFKIATASVNDPPKIVSIPPGATLAGKLMSYTARAYDPDVGDTVVWVLLKGPAGAKIHPTTGVLTWPAASSLSGKKVDFLIRAEDKAKATDTQSFTVLVSPQNQPPKITSTPPTKAFEGQKLTYQARATDPDSGATMRWIRVSGPTSLQINSSSGLLTWTVPAGLGGQKIEIVIRVLDQFGAFDDQKFTLSIDKKNQPPTITSKPPTTVVIGETLTYTVKATDPENDALTWQLVKGPSGVKFSTKTKLLTWKPTVTFLGQSPEFSIKVTDAPGASATQTFKVKVKMRCLLDSDCPGTQICVAGFCEAPGCFTQACSGSKPVCDNDTTCKTNPCVTVKCSSSSFCRDGSCVDVCSGVQCKAGEKCVDGKCVNNPCDAVRCRAGYRCEAGKCVQDPCFAGRCKHNRICHKGRCQADPCANITCPGKDMRCVLGQCIGSGKCQIDADCPDAQVCEGGKCVAPGCLLSTQACSGKDICYKQKCQADTCPASCPAGQFCRLDRCVASCDKVQCKSGERCQDGKCVKDDCAGVTCKSGEVCIAGKCTADACSKTARPCKHGRVCAKNACQDDPCTYVQCPANQRCQRGQCIAPAACTYDADCKQDQLCVKGRCLVPGCGPSQPCKSGEVCLDGACVQDGCDQKKCAEGEFCRLGKCIATCAGVFCKSGELCVDGKCVKDDCKGVSCKSDERCVAGKCVKDGCGNYNQPCKQGRVCKPDACKDNPCLHIQCPKGQLCKKETGQCTGDIQCTFDIDCPQGGVCVQKRCQTPGCYLQTCVSGAQCRNGECKADPCDSIQCSNGDYCHDGICKKTCNCPKGLRCGERGCEKDLCAGVTCEKDETCHEGFCKPSCKDKACRYGRVCIPDSHCQDDPCAGKKCPNKGVCRNGICTDPCMEQDCPAGTYCKDGQCLQRPEPSPEPEPDPEPLPEPDASVVEVIKEKVSGETNDSTGTDISQPAGGCDCSQVPMPSLPLATLLLLGLVAVVRRSRKEKN